MNMEPTCLTRLTWPASSRESLAERYTAVDATLDRGLLPEALAAWDTIRRDHMTWTKLAMVRFNQDTTDASARAEQALSGELAPVVTGHDVAVKRRLLALPDRQALVTAAGAHAVSLWEADVTAFDPAIADAVVEEARLATRQTELVASLRFRFRGEPLTLQGLVGRLDSQDRTIRHDAHQALLEGVVLQRGELDSLFDGLVRLRHGMARNLGFASFTALGYRRMRKTDYGPAEVERFRDAVVELVVPVVARQKEAQRRSHGLEHLYAWDLVLGGRKDGPEPAATPDEVLDAVQRALGQLDERLGALLGRMRADGHVDCENRPGKARGAFCEPLPSLGMPFVFTSPMGTQGDVGTLVHEMGHALQMYESRAQPSFDYLEPPGDIAEVHAMSLGFLLRPHWDLLFGREAAERTRDRQIADALLVLPDCAMADHFQHEVYARPNMTPADREALWRALRRRYTPWVDWGDLDHLAAGAEWQLAPHFFQMPFYAIEYALAQCCALQFWVRAGRDPAGTMNDYMALCARGGSAPFGELVRSAGLRSPFDPGALAESVRQVEEALREEQA